MNTNEQVNHTYETVRCTKLNRILGVFDKTTKIFFEERTLSQ